MTTVAIIGAGPLGRRLALGAARAGFRVLLEDVMPGNLRHARESIRPRLGDAVMNDIAAGAAAPSPQAEPDTTPGDAALSSPAQPAVAHASTPAVPSVSFPAVAFVSTIEDAVREADLVIDCVPDELESKLEILWLVDRMAPPRTVIATPTTNLSIADLASCTNRPEKCIAIAASPPALADLADLVDLAAGADPELLLCAGPATSDETVTLLVDFWQRLGFSSTVDRTPAY